VAGSPQCQCDRGAAFSSDQLAKVFRRQVLGTGIVHFHDQVANNHSRIVSGRAGHKRSDFGKFCLLIDMEDNSNAAKTSFVFSHKIMEFLFVEILRMFIELREPAVDHVLNEFLPLFIRQFADVIRIHFGKDFYDLPNKPVVLVRCGSAIPNSQPQPNDSRNDQQPDQISLRHCYLSIEKGASNQGHGASEIQIAYKGISILY